MELEPEEQPVRAARLRELARQLVELRARRALANGLPPAPPLPPYEVPPLPRVPDASFCVVTASPELREKIRRVFDGELGIFRGLQRVREGTATPADLTTSWSLRLTLVELQMTQLEQQAIEAGLPVQAWASTVVEIRAAQLQTMVSLTPPATGQTVQAVVVRGTAPVESAPPVILSQPVFGSQLEATHSGSQGSGSAVSEAQLRAALMATITPLNQPKVARRETSGAPGLRGRRGGTVSVDCPSCPATYASL